MAQKQRTCVQQYIDIAEFFLIVGSFSMLWEVQRLHRHRYVPCVFLCCHWDVHLSSRWMRIYSTILVKQLQSNQEYNPGL